MSRYSVYITPAALKEIKDLPGHMRQRVRRAVDDLADNSHPSGSKTLDVSGVDSEILRLRLEKWRIIYAVSEADKIIDVLAVRKRPPYDYGDLEKLLANIG